jgi:hypothetical protein
MMKHGNSNGLVINQDTERMNITNRLDSIGVDDHYIGVACYDWSNWSEHYEWCMTASKDEIETWADSILRDELDND